VDREAIPKLGPFLFSEVVRERFWAMDIQVIHDQMYSVGLGVAADDSFQRLG
jgi:hypothetical protein